MLHSESKSYVQWREEGELEWLYLAWELLAKTRHCRQDEEEGVNSRWMKLKKW